MAGRLRVHGIRKFKVALNQFERSYKGRNNYPFVELMKALT
jgi:hypothetical protein